jgi:hypothetical protein
VVGGRGVIWLAKESWKMGRFRLERWDWLLSYPVREFFPGARCLMHLGIARLAGILGRRRRN